MSFVPLNRRVQTILSVISGNIFTAMFLRLLLVLLVYSICRILFFWYNQDLFSGMEWSRFSKILIGGIRFDVAGILYLNVLMIFLVIIPWKLKFKNSYQRAIHAIFMVFNTLGIFVNLADMVYYRTTLRRTTLSVMDQFQNETNLGILSFRFITEFWMVTLLFIALIFILFFASSKIQTQGPKFHNNYTFYFGGIIPAIIILGLFIGGVRGDFRKSTRPITISNAAAYAEVPEDVYLVVNTPFSLIRTSTTDVIKKVHYFSSEEELAGLFNPVHQPKTDSVFKSLNVVVIILESFSMEFFGFYNKEKIGKDYVGYTPFLDSLASKSRTYEYSFANGRKSIDAMPTVLSSIPSIEVPFVLSHFSGNKVNSLASLLKSKGYYSAFFHGAPNGSMGFDAFSKQAGFDAYFGKNEFGPNGRVDGIWGIWDHDFFPFFGDKLNELPQPFCAAMFSLSSHHPFELPSSHAGKYKTGDNKMYPMVQYTDEALKDLFNKISGKPWFKNTLFVITADHVSSEVTHPNYKTGWGQYAVPVIFYQYGMDPLYIKDQVAQQMDILPTVLFYLNYDQPFVAFGKNLLDHSKDEAFNYASPAYQFYQSDLLFRFDGNKPISLFNFRDDPLLKNNLMEGRDLTSFENKLKAFIQQYNNRMVENRLIISGE